MRPAGRQARTEPSAPQLGQTLEFMRVLWQVDHRLQSVSKRMAKRIGVTGPQRLVIRVLGRSPGISAGELSEILCIHPSTLTGVLQRLEKKNLIAREYDREDARRLRLKLTARGRQIDGRHDGTVEAAVRRALARVEPADIGACRELLGTLADELVREK